MQRTNINRNIYIYIYIYIYNIYNGNKQKHTGRGETKELNQKIISKQPTNVSKT